MDGPLLVRLVLDNPRLENAAGQRPDHFTDRAYLKTRRRRSVSAAQRRWGILSTLHAGRTASATQGRVGQSAPDGIGRTVKKVNHVNYVIDAMFDNYVAN